MVASLMPERISPSEARRFSSMRPHIILFTQTKRGVFTVKQFAIFIGLFFRAVAIGLIPKSLPQVLHMHIICRLQVTGVETLEIFY